MPTGQLHYRGPRHVPRAKAIPVVENHLRAPPAGAEHPPIVVVFGPKGIGKTTLLQELNDQFARRTPRALIECSRDATPEIRDLLVEVKLELGRYCPGIGRLRFRRLEIGLAATREQIDFSGDRRRAVRTLLDRVLEEISLHPRDVGGAVGGWVDGGTLSVVPRSLRRLAAATVATLSGLLSRRLLLRFLRRYLDWYGHRDQQNKDDPLDVLASLNWWAFDPARQAQRDERLIEAFLADLRDAFGRGRLARSRWFNCVLLVDDVDSDVGQAILKHVGEIRLKLQIAGAAAEPLLILATSRRRLPAEDLEQHRLPELTEAETGWLTEQVPGAKRVRGEADHRFHKILHQFTGGYPEASALITEAASRSPSAAAGSLEALLTSSLDDEESTVEDRVLDGLTVALLKQPGQIPFPDDALDSLVTCALARTQEEADWLAENYAESFAITPVLLAGSGLWNDDERTAAHDLLLRLMLRRLAVRDSGRPSWETLCGELRDRRREKGDLAGELYYALAAGEIGNVARRLAEHLTGRDIERSWLELLTFVTRAPRVASYVGAPSPYQQQVDLARTVVEDATSHLGQVAALTAGLWLDNDPCTPPDREDLHHQIALDYRTIAPRADQPMMLQREARRHDALAQYWS